MLNLTNLPVPILSQKQLNTFTKESILSKQVTQLNFKDMQNKLRNNIGQKVCVFDIGATAIKADILEVQPNGEFKATQSFGQEEEKKGGKNYLNFILRTKEKYNNLPVVISSKGQVNEIGELTFISDLPSFFSDLQKAGNFQKIFNQPITVLNDAVCLSIAGFFGAIKKYPKIKQVIVIINGGGIGGAIINNQGQLFSTEIGHTPLIEDFLNPYFVKTPCGSTAGNNVCLERVGAVGTGIEIQWEILKGQKLTGEEIGKLIPTDETALKLFDTSALITAHIIEGLRKTHEMILENTAIICHGGCFKSEGYAKRIKQILEKYYLQNITLITTQELGYENACMAGAAIAVLTPT